MSNEILTKDNIELEQDVKDQYNIETVEEISDYYIEINDYIRVKVVMDDEVGAKARDAIDALLISRSLQRDPQNIDISDRNVVRYANALLKQNKDPDLPEWMKPPAGINENTRLRSLKNRALRMIRSETEQWTTESRIEGLKVGLLNNSLIEVTEVDGSVRYRPFYNVRYLQRTGAKVVELAPELHEYLQDRMNTDTPLTAEFFDDRHKNEQRSQQGLPPVYDRDPTFPQEAMVAWMRLLEHNNMNFLQEINDFFNKYVDRIVSLAYDVSVTSEEVSETDDQGFLDIDLEGDIQTAPSSDGEAG